MNSIVVVVLWYLVTSRQPQTPYVSPEEEENPFWPTEETLAGIPIPEYPPEQVLSAYGYSEMPDVGDRLIYDEQIDWSRPDFDEAHLSPEMDPHALEEELMTVFVKYDKDFNRFVTKLEILKSLRDMLSELMEQVDFEQYVIMIDTLFEEYDKDGNGLDMDEFIEMAQIERSAFMTDGSKEVKKGVKVLETFKAPDSLEL